MALVVLEFLVYPIFMNLTLKQRNCWFVNLIQMLNLEFVRELRIALQLLLAFKMWLLRMEMAYPTKLKLYLSTLILIV